MSEIIQTLYDSFNRCPAVSIDSRRIVSGGIFFGLKGERIDGSEFGGQALDQGAAFAVVRDGSDAPRKGLIQVDNPLAILQELALTHRRHLTIPILGITGSNGKTTTKELISRVLSTHLKTRATVGNLNNHIGVPLSILSITREDEIAIIEMGANHVGEIAMLCDMALPTHGVITNIGKAHLDGFGGIEGVKKGKSELYHALRDVDGVAFVNKDAAFLDELSDHVKRRVEYGFGVSPSTGTTNLTFVREDENGGLTLSFEDNEGQVWSVKSKLFGQYNLQNIATAVAIGLYFNVPGDQICSAIESYEPQNNRSQRVVIGTNTVILDAYNANPSSMAEAIRSFRLTRDQQKLLVLGTMMELGEYGSSAHLEIAQQASAVDNATVVLVGDEFRKAADQIKCQWYADIHAYIEDIAVAPPSHTQILIKGSRAMKLELLADALKRSIGAGQ